MKKGLFKRIGALVLAGTLIVTSASSIYASNEVLTDSTGKYEVEKEYRVTESEYNERGTAPEGYEWQDGTDTEVVDTEEAVCGQHEHSEDCYESRLVCNKHVHDESCEATRYCKTKEHQHSEPQCYKMGRKFVCGKYEHIHDARICGWYCTCTKNHWHDWNCPGEYCCGLEEHKHTDDCKERVLTCKKKEHTHSDDCAVKYIICGKPNHTHTDCCYRNVAVCDYANSQHKHNENCYKQQVTVYVMKMVAKALETVEESNTVYNGNQKIKIDVNVAYKTAGPISGYKVKVKVKDFDIFAKMPNPTFEATTDANGNVYMNISSTYDRVQKIVVVDKEGNTVFEQSYNDFIGLTNSKRSYKVVLDDPVVEHTVTFMNGREEFATQPVVDGEKAVAPETSPEGYEDSEAVFTFDKWVDENGNDYDFDSAVTSDIILYATFVKEYKDVAANFYLLKKGEVAPSGLKSDSSSKYVGVGAGKLYGDKVNGTTDKTELAAMIKVAPTEAQNIAALKKIGYNDLEISDFGLTIGWYRSIHESDGWHVDGKAVDSQGNEYIQDDHKVLVTWLDENGAELQKTYYAYGTVPSYVEATPTKASDFDKTYAFKGFGTSEESDEVVDSYSAVVEDTVFYAKYEATDKEKATVTFVNEGEVVKSLVISYENGQATIKDGEEIVDAIVAPKVSKTANSTFVYMFAGWAIDDSIVDVDKLEVKPGSCITLTAKYDAIYKGYSVTFMNGETELKVNSNYHYGDAISSKDVPVATKEADETYTYEFIGWADAEGNAVSVDESVIADIVIYAQFESVYIDYAVKFVNYDGEEIQVNSGYHYGELISSKEVPTAVRPSDGTYTYEFAGWVDADENAVEVDSAVVADVTLKATYTQTEVPVVVPEDPEDPDDPDVPSDDDDDNGEEVVDDNDDNEDDGDDDNKKKDDDKKDDSNKDDDNKKSDDNNGGVVDDNDDNGNVDDENKEDSTEEVASETEEASTEESTESIENTESVTNIEGEETPLGAQADNCIIHWIILILSILMAGYTIVRVVVLKSSEETSESEQEA